MDDWTQVRWTEARQILSLMGQEEAELPEPGIDPKTYYAARRAAQDRSAATNFLGHALPRLEAIVWASHILDEQSRTITLAPMDRQALDYALRWIGDPNDDRRRTAMDAAGEAGRRSPERLLGMAVFYSGGSISLPDMPPVLPPPEAAGRLAASAILIASHRVADAAGMLDHALDMGEKIATQGTGR